MHDRIRRMRAQPINAVREAESSRWYQELLNCRSGHGGPRFERLRGEGCPGIDLRED